MVSRIVNDSICKGSRLPPGMLCGPGTMSSFHVLGLGLCLLGASTSGRCITGVYHLFPHSSTPYFISKLSRTLLLLLVFVLFAVRS